MTMYDPYEELANAIIKQACEDWKSAKIVEEFSGCLPADFPQLLEFFESNWYKELTTIEAKYILDRLEREFMKEQAVVDEMDRMLENGILCCPMCHSTDRKKVGATQKECVRIYYCRGCRFHAHRIRGILNKRQKYDYGMIGTIFDDED